MTWSSRALVWTVALAAGLVFQTPAARVPQPSSVATACPPGIAELTASQPNETARCRGWGAAEFIGGTKPADVLVRSTRPYAGAPCREVHYYRAAIVGSNVVSAFAGGVTRGTFALDTGQLAMAAAADPYVTDVQLGTESPEAGRLACALDSTYHFSCPPARTVDRFCVTWVRRGRPGLPG